MTKRRTFRIAMIVLSCALAATQSGRCASSVDDPQSSPQAAGLDLPSGAIESMEQANAALDTVAKERKRADAEYKSRQSECYRKFLATPCLEREKKLHQKHIAQLEAIELKASRFSRQERNRQVEARRRAAEEEHARSAEQRTTAPTQDIEKTRQKQEKTARTASSDSKPRGAHTIRSVDDAMTRRLSAEKYQKKEREAAEHRERTAKTRAEKVAKRAQRSAKQQAQQQARQRAQQQAQQGKKAASPIPTAAESGPATPAR